MAGRQFEIGPTAETGPYRAVIVTDTDDFSHGTARIVPPFEASAGYLKGLSEDVGVEISWTLSGKESTLANFLINKLTSDNGDNEFNMTPKERVAYTFDRLLRDLGSVADVSHLREQYYVTDEGTF